MLFTVTHWQVTILSLAVLAVAHLGSEEQHHLQAMEAHAAGGHTKGALERCASRLEAQGVQTRAMKRRKTTFDAYRTEMGIPFDSPYVTSNGRNMQHNNPHVLNTPDGQGDPNKSRTMGNDPDAFNATTFAVLSPDGDAGGPAYVPGEHIRDALSTGEDTAPGIFVVADIQLVNVGTCEPVADAWAGVWSCNAAGAHPGTQPDTSGGPLGAGGLSGTALRGVQKSGPEGVVQLTYDLPGHCLGHQHIVVRENATVLPDGTLLAGEAGSHAGRLFWDQALVDEVVAWGPHTGADSKVPPAPGSDDINFRQQAAANAYSEPVYSYASFGEDLSSGVFAWILIGIDPSAS